MSVVESRQHRAAFRVDDGRLRAAEAHDLALAAGLEDLAAANGDGVRNGAVIVGGVDPGVVDDEVDRAAVVVALGSDDEAGDERTRHDRDDEISG
ncbi:hypothetical protein D3C83_67410 [compost metagenome]